MEGKLLLSRPNREQKSGMKCEGGFAAGLIRGALDVLSFQTFGAFDNLKLDGFPFVQGFEALTLNGGVMNEHILAGILGNETKTFFVVEPLDFAAGHNIFLVAETQIKKDTPWFPPAGVPSQFTKKRMRLEITYGLIKNALAVNVKD